MNNHDPLIHYIEHYPFNEILCGYSTRIGGYSNPPYQSLNTGFGSEDDPDNVLQNRYALCKKLGVNLKQLIYPQQQHTNNIVIADNSHIGKGTLTREDAISSTDGLLTCERGMILCVQTADCMPVFLCDKGLSVVAVIHAGWKGTVSNILGNTVAIYKNSFNINPESIYVHLGPSIRSCCYEVGEEFKNHFKNLIQRDGSLYADLVAENSMFATQSGIPEGNISISKYCTHCEEEHFYSYRRDGEKTGRMTSFIGLKQKTKSSP